MADTRKPSLKVREFRLFELEKIAASPLAKGPHCVRGRRVNIERQFTDEHGHVLVDDLASAISHGYDVNFNPARRRLKLLGYHRSHRWELD